MEIDRFSSGSDETIVKACRADEIISHKPNSSNFSVDVHAELINVWMDLENTGDSCSTFVLNMPLFVMWYTRQSFLSMLVITVGILSFHSGCRVVLLVVYG